LNPPGPGPPESTAASGAGRAAVAACRPGRRGPTQASEPARGQLNLSGRARASAAWGRICTRVVICGYRRTNRFVAH